MIVVPLVPPDYSVVLQEMRGGGSWERFRVSETILNNKFFFLKYTDRVVSRISFFFLGGGQFFSQKKFFFRREKMVFQGFLGVFRAFSTKPRSHQENPIPQSFRISWWYVASVRV